MEEVSQHGIFGLDPSEQITIKAGDLQEFLRQMELGAVNPGLALERQPGPAAAITSQDLDDAATRRRAAVGMKTALCTAAMFDTSVGLDVEGEVYESIARLDEALHEATMTFNEEYRNTSCTGARHMLEVAEEALADGHIHYSPDLGVLIASAKAPLRDGRSPGLCDVSVYFNVESSTIDHAWQDAGYDRPENFLECLSGFSDAFTIDGRLDGTGLSKGDLRALGALVTCRPELFVSGAAFFSRSLEYCQARDELLELAAEGRIHAESAEYAAASIYGDDFWRGEDAYSGPTSRLAAAVAAASPHPRPDDHVVKATQGWLRSYEGIASKEPSYLHFGIPRSEMEMRQFFVNAVRTADCFPPHLQKNIRRDMPLDDRYAKWLEDLYSLGAGTLTSLKDAEKPNPSLHDAGEQCAEASKASAEKAVSALGRDFEERR